MREGNLFVSLLVHEVEGFAIVIEELVGAALYSDGINLCTGGEGVLQNTAVLQVAELGLYESGALAGLYVLEINYNAGLAIEVNVESVLEISSCCHKLLIFGVSRALQTAKITNCCFLCKFLIVCRVAAGIRRAKCETDNRPCKPLRGRFWRLRQGIYCK